MDRKLQKAIKILASMLKEDIPIGRIVYSIQEGSINELEIYNLLEKHGYEWINSKWQLYRPEWLLDVVKQFKHDMQGDGSFYHMQGDGFYKLLLFKPVSEKESEKDERIRVFGNYLANMESFVEGEIKKRSSEWGRVEEKNQKIDINEKLVTPHEQDLLDQIAYNDYIVWETELRHTKDFAHILRNSFFVNLCAHLENDLCTQCSDPVSSPTIKSATKQLIHSLVNKIPEWQDILRFVDIRNCIVHNDSILNQSRQDERDKRIVNYCKTKKNIVIKDDAITLEKGFCEDALRTVERFLQKIKIILSDLEPYEAG